MKQLSINSLRWLIGIVGVCSLDVAAQEPNDTTVWNELEDFVFTQRKSGKLKDLGPENAFQINQAELCRAACCNLGESFTTNASVDVNYSDPATGAKQIKLLGLSGSYVQLLTENMPNFRGAARPYALRYVPGPWMKSISVSKGCSSVKNGFESMSGQINVEYLKPQDPAGEAINLYIDSDVKVEANVDANFHITPKLNTEILAHYEDRFMNHDGNDDGFVDSPDLRQINFQNRWNYLADKYKMHAGFCIINEDSKAGQIGDNFHTEEGFPPYVIRLKTQRYEGYMKHAFILNNERGENIAFMASGSYHGLGSTYGYKGYDIDEANANAQLMYESDFGTAHNLSVGLSYNYDYLNQRLNRENSTNQQWQKLLEKETTAGGYAQYTFKFDTRLTAMAGIRGDYSSRFGWFVTPRFNVRYTPVEVLTLRGSVGKGYRSVFGWAEYNYLLASGRQLVVEDVNQEASWNYGANATVTVPVGGHTLRFDAEYFYTRFSRQVIADYDSDPHKLTITNLSGKSFSHTFQIEGSFESDFGLTLTAAWRLNNVKSTYGGVLME
ncbi:MAG: TonB-dependent receptor, partial [Muribaculaceae bacterium]|nr:TonB-dependent receptor [Muribaculaceae bacterium]